MIGGGFSRRMWRVALRVDGRPQHVIVRIEQGGMFGTDTVTEVRAMRALHAAGFAVPDGPGGGGDRARSWGSRSS